SNRLSKSRSPRWIETQKTCGTSWKSRYQRICCQECCGTGPLLIRGADRLQLEYHVRQAQHTLHPSVVDQDVLEGRLSRVPAFTHRHELLEGQRTIGVDRGVVEHVLQARHLVARPADDPVARDP